MKTVFVCAAWVALQALACMADPANARPPSLVFLQELEAGREGQVVLPGTIRFQPQENGEVGDLGLGSKYNAGDLAMNKISIGKEDIISGYMAGDVVGAICFKYIPAWAPMDDLLKLKSRGSFFARLGMPEYRSEDKQFASWGFFTVRAHRLLALLVVARFNDDGSVRGAAFQSGFVDIPDQKSMREVPNEPSKSK